MEDVAAQWVGRVIDGRYAVDGVLGEGGMGVVLRARHKFTGALAAVKVLRPELASNEMLQARFLAEARAPSAIGHPGIAVTTDAGRSSDGLLYLAMELLQGRSLRVAVAKDELRAQDVRRILLELLDALVAAHARGFVHRDLKPDNVFLVDPGGTVKLLDFGIAKVVDAALPKARTQAGSPMGTPAYMSPEQIHDPSKVDARTDLWAVGVMTFELLTRRLPWEGPTVGALLARIDTQPPTPISTYMPTATAQLSDFFTKVFSRDPNHRFADAAEMKQVLWSMPFGTTTASGSGQNMTLVTGSGASSSGFAATAAPGAFTPPPMQTPPPNAGTPHPTPPPPPPMNTPIPAGYISVVQKPNHTTPIVIGVVGVVGIVAIVLAIVLTRSSPAPAPAGPGPQVAMIVDAAIVQPAIADAAPAPPHVDATLPRDPKKPKEKTKTVVKTDAGSGAKPETGSGAKPEDPYAGHTKVDPIGGSIESDASAGLAARVCKTAATGKGSCSAALNCSVTNLFAKKSLCECVTPMSSTHARLYSRWLDCYSKCKYDTNCQTTCGQNFGATCSSQ